MNEIHCWGRLKYILSCVPFIPISLGSGLGFAQCSHSVGEGYLYPSHMADSLGGGGEQREKVEEGGELCGRSRGEMK